MTNRTALRLALSWLRNGKSDLTFIAPLQMMIRPKFYEHGIRYPIEHCTADDNIVLPEDEAAIWLYTERDMGRLGPWETAVQHDDSGYWLCVNFERDEDAVAFKMKWGRG